MQTKNPSAPVILTVLAAAIVLSFGIQRPANAGGRHHYGIGYYGHTYGYGHSYGHRYFGGHHYGYRPYVGYNYRYGPPVGNYAYSQHPGHAYDSRNTASGGSGGAYGTATPAPGNAPAAAADNWGWTQLAEGRYGEALSVFADQANNAPLNGRPKIGYALAVAGAGDLNRGAWAMRRALSIDPRAFHYVTANDALKLRINEFITRYVERPQGAVPDTEAALMVASLYYLLGHGDSARTAIKDAGAGSDAAALNLSRMIERDLSPANATVGNGDGEAPPGGDPGGN